MIHEILSAPFTKLEIAAWVLVLWGSLAFLRWFCNKEINAK